MSVVFTKTYIQILAGPKVTIPIVDESKGLEVRGVVFTLVL